MNIPLNGWLNIDKPLGVTSNQVLGILKRVIRSWGLGVGKSSQFPTPKPQLPKIGHAGTLDPLASGILPIALGEATKTIPYLMDARKTYEFTIQFGAETETCDAEGKITKTTDILPSLEGLEKIIPQFTGKIKQTPPAYSAIKINGERAYDLARKGVEFEIKEREIEVYSLVVIDRINTNPLPLETAREKDRGQSITLKCICSKGTYIRSLARDIARALGSLGYVTYLRRTEYGGFGEESALKISFDAPESSLRRQGSSLNNIDTPATMDSCLRRNDSEYGEKDIFKNQGLQTSFESIISQIQPIDVVLDDIPVLHLDGDLCKRLRDGQSVNHKQAGSFRVYFNGKLHSIAKCDGEKLKTVTVFN